MQLFKNPTRNYSGPINITRRYRTSCVISLAYRSLPRTLGYTVFLTAATFQELDRIELAPTFRGVFLVGLFMRVLLISYFLIVVGLLVKSQPITYPTKPCTKFTPMERRFFSRRPDIHGSSCHQPFHFLGFLGREPYPGSSWGTSIFLLKRRVYMESSENRLTIPPKNTSSRRRHRLRH
ncbi:unnamed protein product [Laminaria digitata]